MESTNKPVFLFLSPHLDDAALSCGGLIKHLTAMGHLVVIATIFTADAPINQPISWLAQRNHRAWDLHTLPFKMRRDEDENAARVLRADYSHLGFLDAMYRVDDNGIPLYPKTTIGTPVHRHDYEKEEPAIQLKFREITKQYSSQTLYIFSPLALGDHVDHWIVRNAAQSTWKKEQIIYYEDFPYAGRPNIMQTWFDTEGKINRWESLKVALSENEIAACVDSVASYSSQLHGLFPSQVEKMQEIVQARLSFLAGHRFSRNIANSRRRMEIFIREYINTTGGERFWWRGISINKLAIFLAESN